MVDYSNPFEDLSNVSIDFIIEFHFLEVKKSSKHLLVVLISSGLLLVVIATGGDEEDKSFKMNDL